MAVSSRRRGKDHRDLALKRVVEAIKPGAARYFVWDATEAGFGVDVWPSGTRTWCLVYRANGIQRRMTLGSVDEVPPDAARKKARAAKLAVDEGRDPFLERKLGRDKAVDAHKARRNAATVADVADRYLETLRAKRSARWAKEAQRLLETAILPEFGAVTAADLTIRHVERLHEGMRDRPFLANRVKAVVSAVIETAIRHRDRPAEAGNPAHAVEAYPEPPRERALAAAEWRAMARAFAALRDEIAGAPAWDTRPAQLALIESLALTGARMGALQLRRVGDVDLERRIVTVSPAHKGVSRVFLGSAAARVIASRVSGRDRTAPLYPGQPREAQKTAVPLSGVVVVWDRLRQLAGVEDVRLHDLRKSFASVGAELGFSTFVIGGLLGHAVQGVTERHYTQRPDELLLTAADAISEEVARRLQGDETPRKAARRKK